MKKSHVNIEVGLDENKVPESIEWKAPDGNVQSDAKAMFLSVWDKKEKNALALNLWTKECNTNEMKAFFHRTLVGMIEAFERAVPNEEELVRDLYATCNYFAEKTGLISEAEVEEMIQKAKMEKDPGEDIDLKNML